MNKMFWMKIMNSAACMLVALAPMIAMKKGCAVLWGEPECPECLKNLQ